MNQYGRDRGDRGNNHDNNGDNRPAQKFDIAPGAKGKDCRVCGKMIYFATNPKTGKMCPVNADGTPHWNQCKDPNRPERRLSEGYARNMTRDRGR